MLSVLIVRSMSSVGTRPRVVCTLTTFLTTDAMIPRSNSCEFDRKSSVTTNSTETYPDLYRSIIEVKTMAGL